MKTNRKAKCMADGGVLLADAGTKETPEQMLARMNAKYGLGDAGKPQAPQPAPAPAPAPAPHPSTPAGLMGKATEAIGRRSEELRQVSRYARGGIMPVIGAGTGTSDSVPAVVAGQNVRLSNGEGMAVLPARTMKNKAAVSAIEDIIEATNGNPPVKDDDEEAEGMARGGIAGKRPMSFQDGGVKSADELKRRTTDYVVPTPAPTAQEVYAPVGRAASGIAGAFKSLPEGGVIRRAVAEGESVPRAIGRAIVEGGGMPNNGLFGPPGAALPSSMRVAEPSAPRVAPSPASSPSVTAVAPQPPSQAPAAPVPQQAALSSEGRPSAIRSVTNGIGDTGNASFNPQTGVMAFTDKTFDPTKQKFEPGTGAITNSRTGQTMVLTGADPSAEAMPATGAMAVGRDAYGNSTAITHQLKRELAAMQAETDAAYARQSVGLQKSLSDARDYEARRRAEDDRFTRFSNESDTAALARDLARGGAADKAAASKIAALNAMQHRDAAAQSGLTARDVAVIQGANRLADTAAAGRNQMAVVGAQGENQLANTALVGQNQLAVEDIRQSGPEKTLRATKLQGEIEDANAQRAARQGLLSALDAGNPTATEKAWRKGIAAGIVNPEKQERTPAPYRFHIDPMGNGVRVNEATGATDVLDRATNTWKPVSAVEPAPREPANRKAGQTYQTPNGPMIWRGTGWEPVQAR